MDTTQLEHIRTGHGFVAALDQSGGSTPKALRAYGIADDQYSTPEQMFDLVHAMRSRVMQSRAFDRRILAAILFEQTMDRTVDGLDTGDYLWQRKGIVPIVKVDQGLESESNGVQMMKEMTQLDSLLERATAKKMFGTKMRSVILSADPVGVSNIVAQQFAEAKRIADADLVPILEPEVDIKAADKVHVEHLLKQELIRNLEVWGDQPIMFKLTIPSEDGFYADLMAEPAVVRVVALSGGYSRDEASAGLARNPGLIASFSRALLDGLSAQQSDEEFDTMLDASVQQIYEASNT